MSKIRPYKSLLWTARIWAGLIVGALLLLAVSEFSEEVKNHSPSPFVTLFGGNFLFWLPWILAGVGYLIAFWKEWIGGGIALICFIVSFYPYDFIGNDFILVLLSTTPSVLFLIYWWLAYRYGKNQ